MESIISSNAVTHVLTGSSEMILKSDSFPFNQLKYQTLVIAPLMKPFLTFDRDVRASIEIGDIRTEHGRIGTPLVNKKIWSGDDNFSVRSDVGEADKLDNAVQRSSTDEENTASSQIEEGSLESICPKIVEDPNLSKRMNLVNSVLVQTPNLVSFRHPPMQTDYVGNPINCITAARVMD